jgi:internalin A
VRQALEQHPHDHLTLEEYLALCESPGFTRREDKLQLSGYLHDLGICLHFQDDPVLKNLVILKPSWGTDAVYRVLDAPDVIKAHGHFTKAQLLNIWHEAKYAGMHDELLRLMMKFQLCYALEAEGTCIAPQLLTSQQPAYPWPATGSIVIRYQYDFMPKGILSRFIVSMHHLIADGGKLVWKTGVVLEKNGVRAEVIEEYAQRRIRVRLSGTHPQGLFAIVDEHLERLHATFPRLKYERHFPCPCAECGTQAEPSDFALQNLIRRAEKNQLIQCHKSGEMVDAAQLIRALLPEILQAKVIAPPDFCPTEEPPTTESPAESEAAASAPAAPRPAEVFVSYAWTPESSTMVDKLQQAFASTEIKLLRDSEELRYKDSIRDFMRRLGQGNCIVLIISEKYLKSENCMFELTEIAHAADLRERIFPIVLPDANIYKATDIASYVQYWEKEIQELDAKLKTVRGDNLGNLQAALTLFAEIRRQFDGIADTLRDMNALTHTQHADTEFKELIRRIRGRLGLPQR